MVVEGELAVKLYAKDVEVWTIMNGNAIKKKVNKGRFINLDLLRIKDLDHNNWADKLVTTDINLV